MMMKITLKPEQEQFIQAQLSDGKYQSADEVVAKALEVLEAQQRAYDAWASDVRIKVDEAAEALAQGQGMPLETVMEQIRDKFRQAREAQE